MFVSFCSVVSDLVFPALKKFINYKNVFLKSDILTERDFFILHFELDAASI